jgi:2-oxoglutarate dehydrogenase E1 component
MFRAFARARSLVKPGWYSKFTKYYANVGTENSGERSALKSEPFLNGTSGVYLEEMFENWSRDPTSVHKSWDVFFSQVSRGSPPGVAYQPPPTIGSTPQSTLTREVPTAGEDALKLVRDHMKVNSIIRSYQIRAHNAADQDPLKINCKQKTSDLIPSNRGFGEVDMEREFLLPHTTQIAGDGTSMKLKDIVRRLDEVYTGSIGIEYMHIHEPEKRNWIRSKFERPGCEYITDEERRMLLKRLVKATKFEEFLAKKWTSEKRFGLEGCEVLIPALNQIIDSSSALGVDTFVLGMPHRGRLNVLANVARKPLEQIFCQFNPMLAPEDEGSGDVKYHLGTCEEFENELTKKVLSLAVVANPSHLEAVDPVVQGKTRAEQFYRGDKTGQKVMSILIHGDAAFSGQGVVYETFHLSDLPDYTCKGTIHIIANNQIGFTTDPRVARSSPYCTDVAKVVSAPIFHVNADDPEAVMHVCKVAAEWRREFQKDVVIDIVGYRRMGHNETDQPMFTQPLMYQIISKHSPVLKKYGSQLIQQNVVKGEELEMEKRLYDEQCEEALEKSSGDSVKILNRDWLDSPWKGFFPENGPEMKMSPTGIDKKVLLDIGHVFSTPPAGDDFKDFTLHSGIKRMLSQRADMLSKEVADWAMGEAFAFGSLLLENYHVRVSGQDVERGTFR